MISTSGSTTVTTLEFDNSVANILSRNTDFTGWTVTVPGLTASTAYYMKLYLM